MFVVLLVLFSIWFFNMGLHHDINVQHKVALKITVQFVKLWHYLILKDFYYHHSSEITVLDSNSFDIDNIWQLINITLRSPFMLSFVIWMNKMKHLLVQTPWLTEFLVETLLKVCITEILLIYQLWADMI